MEQTKPTSEDAALLQAAIDKLKSGAGTGTAAEAMEVINGLPESHKMGVMRASIQTLMFTIIALHYRSTKDPEKMDKETVEIPLNGELKHIEIGKVVAGSAALIDFDISKFGTFFSLCLMNEFIRRRIEEQKQAEPKTN